MAIKDTKKKETITERYAKKLTSSTKSKPKDLGKGGARKVADAILNRRKQIDAAGK